MDGQLWHSYGLRAKWEMSSLETRVQKRKLSSTPICKVYLPKGMSKTEQRPLGLPTIEDKILQESVRRVLNPIYGEELKAFWYEFQSNRSTHQAIGQLSKAINFGKMHYLIAVAIKNYFGGIDHELLLKFLDLKVKDGVIGGQLDKWLKA